MKSLRNKHIDLGVVSLPLRAPNIRLTPLFEEEMLVLMSLRRSKGYGRYLSLKQLSNLP